MVYDGVLRVTSLDLAVQGRAFPAANLEFVRRLTAAIGISSYEVLKTYIRADRDDGGPALRINYGWTDGFVSRDEVEQIVGKDVDIHESDRAGQWYVWHPVNGRHRGRWQAAQSITEVDTTFDIRSDVVGKNRDPDSNSPTLRRFHQLLWSKRLPEGRGVFDLDAKLRNRSELGLFELASDSISHTYTHGEYGMGPVAGTLSLSDRCGFLGIASTVGATLVFPVGGAQTINQRRGIDPRIKDRFDLTLECIRRWYQHQQNPLSVPLDAQGAFFRLFGDSDRGFRNYVEFFLLQDLVSPDGHVMFFLPFEGFDASPLPAGASAYRAYRDATVKFIQARNARISLDWLNRSDR